MSIWYLCPSARPKEEAEKCFQAWLDFGVQVMILRQGVPLDLPISQYKVGFYAGWAVSNNHLIRTAMQADSRSNWFILGGDDYYPDLTKNAHQVMMECQEHFGGTFGVMQPTGDRYGDGYIDTAAASPWIGLEFCQRVYNGRGPMFEDYYHLYADTELQKVAEIYGRFWQRQDIKQEHKHWSRYGNARPKYAEDLYGHYQERDKALYEARASANFPGHWFIPTEEAF